MKRFFALLLGLIMILCFFSSCTENPADGKDTGTGDATETEAALTDTQTSDTTEAETEPVVAIPDYINPLTGLAASRDFYSERPVAIMINNLWGALPQEGIADCDIMYECLVEGGITRLMVVDSDYEELGVIGSIRSCRHYYLDLAQNYDAIYIHAGASDQGFTEISKRGIDNLNGVNMYIPNMFYRDEERLQTMSYEHTLMTSGERIVGGIAYKKYRTELLDEYKNKDAFNFVEYGTRRELGADTSSEALCVRLPYSKYQTARFDYDKATNSYYRFQFEDVPHIDGTTGEQISFTNVFILFCDVVSLNDKAGHLDITTENENGEGYYISGGRCEKISWSKPTEDSPTVYYGADGEELVVNRGKTFISIFPEYNRQNIEFNYVVQAENQD